MSSKATVRIGFVGAGNVLWAYLQVLDRLVSAGQAALGPVCARRRERWDGLRAIRPDLPLVETAEEVYRSDVDVVVIITAPESHAPLTRAAIEAGKHVLVEKPLAATRGEGEALVELAVRRNVLLLAAPFVQLCPTFGLLASFVDEGAVGRVHSARGLYGNAGSTWARWYHTGRVGPVSELGIYNLKSLTTLLGPVVEVTNVETTAVATRMIAGQEVSGLDPDVSHLLLRHRDGALSSIVSSHAIQNYRRPALELYGTEGTANLLGDDWDPRGIELWRNQSGHWETHEPIDSTWLWTDGLREMVAALRDGRPLTASLDQDLHLLDVLEASKRSTEKGQTVGVASGFARYALHSAGAAKQRHHVHDHTRPAEMQ